MLYNYKKYFERTLQMNKNKLYNLGVICGRFGHEHIGHTSLIENSLLLCNKTLILVGSAQETATLRNPFSVDTRINLIKQTYPDKTEEELLIKPLNDLTNEYDITYKWGKYIKNEIIKHTGTFADLLITGNDKNRSKWFDPKDLINTSKLVVARDKLSISATKIRAMLVIDDKKNWEHFTPVQIHSMYPNLRDELLNVPIYKKIYDEISKTDLSIENFTKLYTVYENLDKQQKIKGLV